VILPRGSRENHCKRGERRRHAAIPADRAVFAFIVAAIAGLVVLLLATSRLPYFTDFDPIQIASGYVLHGRDPYVAIGPGRDVPWNFRLLYPLPAVLVALPFHALPYPYAPALFAALVSGTLAALVFGRPATVMVFLSASWITAAMTAQWSPAMLAASSLPWLGFVLAAKPNIGAAILASARSWHEAAILAGTALVITIAAFVVQPHWFSSWRDAMQGTPHIRPLVGSWLGAPLLLAALRWRDPHARLLLALAVVPMNPALYEGVLLFAIPRSRRDAAVLVIGSWIAAIVAYRLPGTDFQGIGRAMIVCMYLPALAMVLAPHSVRVRAVRVEGTGEEEVVSK
jgi:hypothetical protein